MHRQCICQDKAIKSRALLSIECISVERLCRLRVDCRYAQVADHNTADTLINNGSERDNISADQFFIGLIDDRE